jgi:Fic family protein
MMRKSMNTAHPLLYIWQQPDWPQWRYDHDALALALSHAHQQQGMVLGKAQAIGLDDAAMSQVINQIWIAETIATAGIEGQKLDTDMVRSSVMRKLGLSDTGPVSRHADGLVDVLFDASHNHASALDIDRLCRWQSALFPGGTAGMVRIEVGRLRSFPEPMQIISGSIGKEKVHYRAPDSTDVAGQMTAFLDWFNQPIHIDGIIRSAIAHLWFETIHPFEDGNGRIGRAIIDMALAQDTGHAVRIYSMSRQLQEQRAAYYDALNQAQTGTLDITPWLQWFIRQFTEACLKSAEHIDLAIAKAHFWQAHAHQDINLRQRKTLQKLLNAGDGGFLGGLTAEKHAKINATSKATATRDLTDLLQKGVLISQGIGKATKYLINVPGWHASAI